MTRSKNNDPNDIAQIGNQNIQAIGLPGRRPETFGWMNELFNTLSLSDSRVLTYQHWNEDIEPDIHLEAEKIKAQSIELVVAKSIGTLIAIYAFSTFGFQPGLAVFIGTPLWRFTPETESLLDYFSGNVPVLFIQQSSDPKGSFNQLASMTQSFDLGKTIEIEGRDHQYNDLDELKSIILPWTTGRKG